MVTPPASRLLRLRTSIVAKAPVFVPIRQFSRTKDNHAINRIYPPVRFPDDFSTYIVSSRTPLLTFWTASYCNTCHAVRPILHELLESGVGEEEGGVSFCEVEYDSQDIMNNGLGMTYMISSMPTLLSFDRGVPQTSTRVTDAAKMKNVDWLAEWIRNEARRGGNTGGGGIFGSGLFGGVFGGTK